MHALLILLVIEIALPDRSATAPVRGIQVIFLLCSVFAILQISHCVGPLGFFLC